MAAPKPGDRINNYILESLLGAGTFGQVWRAHHHVLRQVVAIKIPTDGQYVRNLQREAVVIHGLRHPNIVRALDIDPYADPPYLIMEYVDGPTVRRLLEHHPHGLPLGTALAVIRGLLAALGYAHRQGVLHRDIKPENIMLLGSEDRPGDMTEASVRVTDFGLGRVGDLTTASMMQSGSLRTDEGRGISGTFAYMAPEQREGQELDGRADIYACGIVMFELLTGVLPQGADPPSSLKADLPDRLDTIFARCYTRKERRFSTADEMLMALREVAPPSASRMKYPASAQGRMCPSCGYQSHLDDHFCIQCGQQLVDVVPRCRSCQAFVHRHDRYCIFCGSDLRARPV